MGASKTVSRLALGAALLAGANAAAQEYCQRDVTRPFQRGCDSAIYSLTPVPAPQPVYVIAYPAAPVALPIVAPYPYPVPVRAPGDEVAAAAALLFLGAALSPRGAVRFHGGPNPIHMFPRR